MLHPASGNNWCYGTLTLSPYYIISSSLKLKAAFSLKKKSTKLDGVTVIVVE